jgi:hypothetical protein
MWAPDMELNRPEVVAELTEAFQNYEKALVAGDNPALVGYFWDDPELVRFGLADEQRGGGELRDWRLAQPPAAPGRTLRGTVVTTFGADTGVVTTVFDDDTSSEPGRQSQTWVRTGNGWQIVTAHVSRRGRQGG